MSTSRRSASRCLRTTPSASDGPLRGHGDLPGAPDDQVVGLEPVEHLRHRRRRLVQALGQAGLDDRDPLFLEGEDRLEVLLDRGMEAVQHGADPTAPTAGSNRRSLSRPTGAGSAGRPQTAPRARAGTVDSVEPSPTPDGPDDGAGDDHGVPTGSGAGAEGERAEADGSGAAVDGDDDVYATDGSDIDEVPEGSDPLRFNHWMKRSATGAVITGIAIGLQQALETPRQQPAFVIEASDVPDDPTGPSTSGSTPTTRRPPWPSSGGPSTDHLRSLRPRRAERPGPQRPGQRPPVRPAHRLAACHPSPSTANTTPVPKSRPASASVG